MIGFLGKAPGQPLPVPMPPVIGDPYQPQPVSPPPVGGVPIGHQPYQPRPVDPIGLNQQRANVQRMLVNYRNAIAQGRHGYAQKIIGISKHYFNFDPSQYGTPSDPNYVPTPVDPGVIPRNVVVNQLGSY